MSAEALASEMQQRIGGRRTDYDYHDADGRHVGRVMRFDGADGRKQIRQARLSEHGWTAEAMPSPRPLYMLPKLLHAPAEEIIFVTEGEKCADEVWKLGLYATTSSQGAQSASKTDWSPLGRRSVVILPDQDAAGAAYAKEVADLLVSAGVERVATLPLAGLQDGQDVYDWIAARLTAGNARDQVAQELHTLAMSALATAPPPKVEGAQSEEADPFPVAALPPFCREMVESGALAQGVDPAFYGVPMLAILAGCIGNSRRVEIKAGWSEPAVIWAAVVAPSGSGKSPALRQLVRPVQARDRELHDQYRLKLRDYEDAMARFDKKSGQARPEPPPISAVMVDDATLEALVARLEHNPRGLLLVNDELAGFLKSFNKYRSGDDAEKWLRMFGADGIKVDRKGGTGGSRPQMFVPHAAVSIVGTIQPKVAAKYLSGEFRDSGLVARILLAAPPTKPLQWSDATMPDIAVANWHRVVGAMLDLNMEEGGSAKILPLDREAQRVFIDFFNANGSESYSAGMVGDEDLAAALAKLRSYAPRLAMLLELARAAESGFAATVERVGPESMRAGVELVSWFQRQVQRLYASWSRMTPDAEAALDQRIRALFAERSPQSEGEVRDALKRNRTSDEVLASLRRCEQRGWVEFLGEQEPGPAGGRPRRMWGKT